MVSAVFPSPSTSTSRLGPVRTLEECLTFGRLSAHPEPRGTCPVQSCPDPLTLHPTVLPSLSRPLPPSVPLSLPRSLPPSLHPSLPPSLVNGHVVQVALPPELWLAGCMLEETACFCCVGRFPFAAVVIFAAIRENTHVGPGSKSVEWSWLL